MLIRTLRSSIAAVRYFSAEAHAETKAAVATAGKSSSGVRDTLGRRLLSLVFPKRSAVITIRKWKEEGHTVRKYELNRIVRELRKLKRYKHALEVCEWMTLQQDLKLVSGDYAVHLDLIAKVRGMNSAEKFFEDLPLQMTDRATCTALLHTYVQNKVTDKAEALIAKMSECGFMKHPLAYNHMLSLYISNGQLDRVPELIQELKSNTSPDVVTYNLWLTVCATQNDVETAERVFLELKKAKLNPDWVTCSTLTNLYIKNSLTEKAAVTLKEMENLVSQKNRVAYSSLLSLHTNIGDKEGVRRIWKKPCYSTWELLTWGYLQQKHTEKVLEYFKKAVGSVKRWDPDKRLIGEVFNRLKEEGDIQGAEELLAFLRNAGHVSTEIYNSLIRIYAEAGKMPLVIAERMEKDNVQLDDETRKLIKITSKMCVSDISSICS
ncbi:hypothetical protein C1H46_015104 [Malus baccata]|uniref:Pentacotripeptide-repeat region of PRORP domain-containing protein n=1 Tax=Malus baccata TaxID=106549 RepID=A0A540MKK3_MALBA|nr:hypothetical protein C1H46_015104 [Malus baccata]